MPRLCEFLNILLYKFKRVSGTEIATEYFIVFAERAFPIWEARQEDNKIQGIWMEKVRSEKLNYFVNKQLALAIIAVMATAFLVIVTAGMANGEEATSTASVFVNDMSYGSIAWYKYGNYWQATRFWKTYVTYYLKATGFNFDSIPDNAIIEGIEFTITATRSDWGSAYDCSVRAVKSNSVTGGDKSTGSHIRLFPATTTFNYGDSSDLWSVPWTASDVKSGVFGVAFSVCIVRLSPWYVSAYVYPPVTAKITYSATPTCEVDAVTASRDWVAPQKTIGNTQAEVALSLKQPAPAEGCTIDLTVIPVLESGGHDHNEINDGRPTGNISPTSVSFSQGETEKTATYTSSEVSGTEEIIAKINDKETGKASIDVKVQGLVSLGGSTNYRLTGQTNAHLDNHYGTSTTVENTKLIAETFFNEFKATLGINDMSLRWGGLFDIGPPQGSFWSPPHKSHRKGISVDIDRSAQGTDGWIKVDKKYIGRKCFEFGGGSLAPEASIHCEFPFVK